MEATTLRSVDPKQLSSRSHVCFLNQFFRNSSVVEDTASSLSSGSLPRAAPASQNQDVTRPKPHLPVSPEQPSWIFPLDDYLSDSTLKSDHNFEARQRLRMQSKPEVDDKHTQLMNAYTLQFYGCELDKAKYIPRNP
ncbi:MAG: hypothetical protein Q9209_007003 [Squamulea sp. 1 TL-2023]